MVPNKARRGAETNGGEKMKMTPLGQGPEMSSVILGLMRITAMEDTAIRALYDTARDAGITVYDHADIYGGAPHVCEARFGSALNLSAAEREGIILQSKVGIRPGYFDFSKEHILKVVKAMDLFLAVPSVLMDDGIERKQLYGKRMRRRSATCRRAGAQPAPTMFRRLQVARAPASLSYSLVELWPSYVICRRPKTTRCPDDPLS